MRQKELAISGVQTFRLDTQLELSQSRGSFKCFPYDSRGKRMRKDAVSDRHGNLNA